MSQPSLCPVCQSRLWQFIQAPVPHYSCQRCKSRFVTAQQRGPFLQETLQLEEAHFSELVRQQGALKHFCTQCGGRMMGVTASGVDIQTCTSCATLFLENDPKTSVGGLTQSTVEEFMIPSSGLDLDETHYQKRIAEDVDAIDSMIDHKAAQAPLPLSRSPYPTTQRQDSNDAHQGALSTHSEHPVGQMTLQKGHADSMEQSTAETAQPKPGPYPTLKKVNFQNPYEDDQIEAWVRALCLPVTSLIAIVLVLTDLGRFVVKTFFGMYVHEIGHALTAWGCGIWAIPRLWVTSWDNERSFSATLLVAIVLTVWGMWSYKKERWLSVCTAALLFVGMVIGTYALSFHDAKKWITFGGDAGAMIVGTILSATLYVDRHHAFHHGWLRFGFVIIGVMALVSSSYTWWLCLFDFGEIPFGIQEYAGLSDASKLVDVHGWTAIELVHRYVYLSTACFLFIAVQYGYHLWLVKDELSRGKEPTQER